MLHGPMNKKDKLDHYYQLYEEEFEAKDDVEATLRKTTAEIAQLLPDLSKTRWRKKSDFYTLFLAFAARASDMPFTRDRREELRIRIVNLGNEIDAIIKMEEAQWGQADPTAVQYARNIIGAASDRGSRVERAQAFESKVFGVNAA